MTEILHTIHNGMKLPAQLEDQIIEAAETLMHKKISAAVSNIKGTFRFHSVV
ncbi:MAG: hypothetical protein WA667_09275 [Candidatus Nitrosopolaris sp.]